MLNFVSYTYPGLEWILKKELEKRKIKVDEIESGVVKFSGDLSTLVKANLWLRTANKVYLLLSETTVTTFDEVFTSIFKIDWRYYLSEKFSFVLKVKSKKI